MRGFVEKETMLEVLLVIIVIALAAVISLQMVQRGGEERGMTTEQCAEKGGQVCDTSCLPKDKIGTIQEGVRILPCCNKGTCI